MSSGKAYEIRMICELLKIDQESEEAKDLWDFKYSALVVKRKELELASKKRSPCFQPIGALNFSSFRDQEEDV